MSGCETFDNPPPDIRIPAIPAHIQAIAAENGVVIPKKAKLNNKEHMALTYAAVKDSKRARRALKQAIAQYNSVRSAYGSKSKLRNSK